MDQRAYVATIEIPVADLARATKWYVEVLSARQTWGDERYSMLAFDEGPTLFLVRTDDPRRLGFSAGDGGASGGGGAVEHGVIDLRVRDVAALHAHLSGQGVRVGELAKKGPGPRGFGFWDPDGNRFGAFEGY